MEFELLKDIKQKRREHFYKDTKLFHYHKIQENILDAPNRIPKLTFWGSKNRAVWFLCYSLLPLCACFCNFHGQSLKNFFLMHSGNCLVVMVDNSQQQGIQVLSWIKLLLKPYAR